MNLSTELSELGAQTELARRVNQTLARMQSEVDAATVQAQGLSEQLAAAHQTLKVRDLKIQALTLELAHLKRMRYGVRSEALGPEQRALFEESIEADIAAVQTQAEALNKTEEETVRRPRRAHPGRQALPDHLPRVEYRHEPDACTCEQCGKELTKIGEDISEQLDVEPARFFVNRHIRPQYACRACETVQAEPVPAALVDGGLAAVGLYVWVLVGKYLDHLPLYRLEDIAKRQGVELSRMTMSQWVGRIGVALQPLVDRLIELLKHHAVLHADETPMRQLDPGSGKTKRAYLWAYRTNALHTGPPIVVYDYQGSRAGVHARNFLEGWVGDLMVDDYAGYDQLFRHGVRELGCMAHARRKYFDLHQASPSSIAGEALQRIAKLYEIEADLRDVDEAARAHGRAHYAAPLLKDMQRWLLETRLTVATGSGTARAIDYSLKRWEALSRYATRGDLPIDNNAVENSIRPIVLGKKNWLFTGSETAGQRAAAIQTLLMTAKLNGLNPAAWLRDTLEKLPAWPNSRIDELLPLRNV